MQWRIDLNTFLLRKTHSRCITRQRTMLVVHVGWLLGISGHHWWFLVLTGNIWWLWMIFVVLFTTLSLNNSIRCVIFLLFALFPKGKGSLFVQCWQILVFTSAYALNFMNRRLGPYFDCWGSLLGPYFMKSWVPIGSLFLSMKVPISLGNSVFVACSEILLTLLIWDVHTWM